MKNETKQISPIKNALEYLYGLVSNARGCCVVKQNQGSVTGFTFRNLDWTKLDVSKVNAMLPDSWQSMHKVGKDLNPMSTEVGKNGKPLESTYLYIGLNQQKVVTLDDILASANDIAD